MPESFIDIIYIFSQTLFGCWDNLSRWSEPSKHGEHEKRIYSNNNQKKRNKGRKSCDVLDDVNAIKNNVHGYSLLCYDTQCPDEWKIFQFTS